MSDVTQRRQAVWAGVSAFAAGRVNPLQWGAGALGSASLQGLNVKGINNGKFMVKKDINHESGIHCKRRTRNEIHVLVCTCNLIRI